MTEALDLFYFIFEPMMTRESEKSETIFFQFFSPSQQFAFTSLTLHDAFGL